MTLPAANYQFFDWVKQDWVVIREPNAMSEETARRLIPQTPAALRKFDQYFKAGMTPYLAQLTVNSNGGK